MTPPKPLASRFRGPSGPHHTHKPPGSVPCKKKPKRKAPHTLSTAPPPLAAPAAPSHPDGTLPTDPSLNGTASTSDHVLGIDSDVDESADEAVDDEDSERQNKFDRIMNPVITVFCSHTEPNFSQPWQRQRQYSSTSSGFAVQYGAPGKRWLLTNAHSVNYSTQARTLKIHP